MHEDNNRASQRDLDERLTAYYGPELPEIPFAPDAWQRVRAQLRPHRQSRWRFHLPRVRRIRYANSAPPYIQRAFSRILAEAHVPYASTMLGCKYQKRRRAPQVRVQPLGRRNISLLLPSASPRSLEPAELDVLLASGLARNQCRYAGRARYLIVCLLPLCAAILACIAFLLFGRAYVPLIAIPIAMILLTAVIVHREGRKTVFQADELMVQWLGRGAACRGLHALAGRSSRPQVRAWGSVSYTERIDRICGTPVIVEDERFTLVR